MASNSTRAVRNHVAGNTEVMSDGQKPFDAERGRRWLNVSKVLQNLYDLKVAVRPY